MANLSIDEKIRLSQLEERIERGLKGYVEAGEALKQIRDLRLYREQFDSFEAYCEERWRISRARGYQLIGAAEVVNYLKLSTLVDTLPTRERQARPLTRLPKPEAAEVWQETVANAQGAEISAAAVEAAVARRLPIVPRTQVTIVADDHPARGTVVEVQRVEGDLVYCRQDNATIALLKTEVQPIAAKPEIQPDDELQILKELLKEVLQYGAALPAGLVARIRKMLNKY